jgi:hypothetical protein
LAFIRYLSPPVKKIMCLKRDEVLICFLIGHTSTNPKYRIPHGLVAENYKYQHQATKVFQKSEKPAHHNTVSSPKKWKDWLWTAHKTSYVLIDLQL